MWEQSHKSAIFFQHLLLEISAEIQPAGQKVPPCINGPLMKEANKVGLYINADKCKLMTTNVWNDRSDLLTSYDKLANSTMLKSAINCLLPSRLALNLNNSHRLWDQIDCLQSTGHLVYFGVHFILFNCRSHRCWTALKNFLLMPISRK